MSPAPLLHAIQCTPHLQHSWVPLPARLAPGLALGSAPAGCENARALTAAPPPGDSALSTQEPISKATSSKKPSPGAGTPPLTRVPAQPKQQDAPRARLHQRSLQDQQDRRDNSAGQQWSCADLPPPCLRGSQLHCSDSQWGPGPSATHTAPRAKRTVQTGGHTGKRGGHGLGVPPPPALTPSRQTASSAAVSSPGTGERRNAYTDPWG
ncbi:hypothetical protein R6Z07F_003552 [Ovis aries]